MKKLLSIALVAIFMFGVSSISSARGVRVVSGDLSFLKTAKTLRVEFDYSKMSVGKFAKEEDYVKDKVKKYNADEPGRGDLWKESWIHDRERRFEPKFYELFNKYLEKGNLKAVEEGETKYKMVVKTTSTEPGFNVGVMRRPAVCNYRIEFYQEGKDKAIAVVEVNDVPGSQFGGFDFETGVRIAECYALCGKQLAGYIYKKVIK